MADKGNGSDDSDLYECIKSIEDVPQRSTSITVELKTVIELFETF